MVLDVINLCSVIIELSLLAPSVSKAMLQLLANHRIIFHFVSWRFFLLELRSKDSIRILLKNGVQLIYAWVDILIVQNKASIWGDSKFAFSNEP